jgi:hypothetical protein
MTPRRLPHQTARVWLPLIAAGLVGLAGYFGPWVTHRAVGLIVSGLDLGEYVKFVPQAPAGQITVRREFFYLPLFAGSLIASLLASRRTLPRWPSRRPSCRRGDSFRSGRQWRGCTANRSTWDGASGPN